MAAAGIEPEEADHRKPYATASASSHLDRANNYYRDEEYRSALAEFKAAYQISGNPSIHYSVAKAHQKLSEYESAYSYYNKYLAEDGSLEPSRRAQVEAKLAEVLKRQKLFASLPADLWSRRSNFSFVSIRSNNPDVKLQFLADSQEYEGWSWWGGYVWMESEKWKTVCKEECSAPVYRKAILRVTGDDIMNAENFTLPQKRRDVVLTVKTGSRGTRAGAWVMLASGIAMGVLGGILVGVFSDSSETVRSNTAPKWAGLGLGVGGAGLLIGSIPVFLTSRTRVTAE